MVRIHTKVSLSHDQNHDQSRSRINKKTNGDTMTRTKHRKIEKSNKVTQQALHKFKMAQFSSSQVRDPFHYLWLFLLLASTPVAVILAFVFDYPREWCAICNSYAFSFAFLGLYLAPMMSPLVTGNPSWNQRLALSMDNWILYLTCFTEVIQIAHSLTPQALYAHLDKPQEWAFYSYSLSDKRWRDYTPDRGNTFTLPFEVNLINWNDGILGMICLALWVWARAKPSRQTRGCLAVGVVFRDATLWRETVEVCFRVCACVFVC